MIGNTLFSIYNRFYFAVIYNRPEVILDLLSSEKIKRYKNSIKEQQDFNIIEFSSKLTAKLSKQYNKIPYQLHDVHNLSLISVLNDGALAITVAYGDAGVSKPIYFTKEDGEFKLFLNHPYRSSRYIIKNDSDQPHRVECKGGSTQTIPAGEQSYEITCRDDCGILFSGSWFKDVDTGREVTCDYNTWGWDVRFNESGVLECFDDCYS